MGKEIFVKKRDGRLEKLNIDKIHKVLELAVDGFQDVSISEIELHANLSFYDGITTEEIHSLLIRSANDLISEDNISMQYVASRLLLYWIRKKIYGGDKIPRLYDHIIKCVDAGVYDKYILEKYTESEIHKIDRFIDHDRDLNFTYCGLQQLCDKYLCQNRATGKLYETPQFMYSLIAMTLFANYDEKCRLVYIKKCYDYLSKFKLSLATPVCASVRTPEREYASCCLIDVDDSMESIMSSITAAGYHVSRKAGLGINLGRLRPVGSPIRNGSAVTTGFIPFCKAFEAAVKSCSQGSIRNGSATITVPFWHYEIEDIVVLKNNSGSIDNRCRNMDYTVVFDKVFYQRLINDDYITLFSPAEAKGLYDVFGLPEFEELYVKYEKDDKLKFRKRIKARAFAELFMRERLETGRIYVFNIDHANSHSSWLDKTDFSNLCLEITHSVKPIKHIDDPNGEIGICILSAINLLEIKNFSELESVCDIAVRLLDEVIDHQVYPVKASENFAKKRRSIGIGITNLAALLATNKLNYEDPKSLYLIDEWMEALQYNLLKASCNLAKEKGRCEKFDRTKYSEGLLPIDHYCKNVDALVSRKYSFDWEQLRADISEHGLRHSTVSAQMPCESSSCIQNSCNGMEPPRNLLSIKKSKKGNLKQIVPEYIKYKNYYTLAFNMSSNIGIMNIAAVMQKWLDQSISLNLYYNYEKFPNKEIPISTLIKDHLYLYKYGVKSAYYLNTTDVGKASVEVDEEKCAGGACSI